MYRMLLERGGLAFVAAGAIVASLVGVLSVWGVVDASMWWQGLLTLGIILITVWTLVGALRYRTGEVASHVPAEAVWALVGVAIVAFVSYAGLTYGTEDFVEYDTGYNDGFNVGYESGLIDGAIETPTTTP